MLRAFNISSKISLFIVTALGGAVGGPAAAQQFDGDFHFAWLDGPEGEHREMRVLSPVSFTSENGKVWRVPANAVIDGASIPRGLWSFAGSPFVGQYRRASVIHDHYCDIKTEPQRDVHLMFREAMYADGASWWEAETKYIAVKVAALCPQMMPLAMSDLDLLLQSRPGSVSNTIMGQLKSDRSAQKTAAEQFQDNYTATRADLNETERGVYDQLIEFKKNPESDDVFEELEKAVTDANLPADRYGELAVLVNATFPDDYSFR